jgi:colanic acid biosynthesis protein WcaH
MNHWFVPGGRIKKDEGLDIAFKRITNSEFGEEYCRKDSRFIGIFEHKYDTNFLEEQGIGTHYIVLAYEIKPIKIP